MSYDLYVLPWRLATDAESAARVMQQDFDASPPTTQHPDDSPVQALISHIVDSQRRRGIEHETPEPLRSGTYITASWSDAEQSREIVMPLAATWGFDVYDPQENIYIDTEHAVPIAVLHGSLGRLPMLSPQMLNALVDRLEEPDPFLVIERDSEVYVQTRARDEGTFDLEYRDGSSDRHFATVTDAGSLPEQLWAWVVGGAAALSGMTWTKVEL
ncbi:hypothetical protein J8M97_24780 [Gordonia polyisoprenivorans]|uniref:hypothetical protein n=1 Tax=Gordonia polyisoprenivorans TaxID=84595 RepID=UPI001B8CBFF9|nr:hypothetical protein [Gordonia polyisoprenivorans]QUD82840.1 hypothetical protein J8M97_24780 [Gordonia polyisoprenivorans]UZF56313.1 hypothetical protein LH935_27245 [Gordonia polyisoprenivorans]